MLLMTVGTQKFRFDRLLRKMDTLIEQGIIKDKVIAQIGYSNYHPLYYSYTDFISEKEFNILIEKSDILITHGGVGTVIKGLLCKKRVIIVPRKKEYGEHIDNHQFEIGEEFSKRGYTVLCKDIEELAEKIEEVSKREFSVFNYSWFPIAEYVQNYLKTLEGDYS